VLRRPNETTAFNRHEALCWARRDNSELQRRTWPVVSQRLGLIRASRLRRTDHTRAGVLMGHRDRDGWLGEIYLMGFSEPSQLMTRV